MATFHATFVPEESFNASFGETQVIHDDPLVPATTTTLGGIVVGEDLKITAEGVLSVDKATAVGDFTKPITAAAVYTEVGNINVLLQTI